MNDAERNVTARELEDAFHETRELARESLRGAIDHVAHEPSLASMSEATVGQAMTAEPVTATADATAADAARVMMAEDLGSLPVVEGETLVGMVTDRDLVARVMARGLDPNKVAVSECCSPEPVAAHPHDGLSDAVRRMAEAQVRRLPVIEGGRLVGILAQADIALTAPPVTTGGLVHAISKS